mmetsp:Transcript_14140/g.32900  ORF Transcript_14140/g.32900 Transcript_14140/m.32900 type:complete len:308 (-) Transcript_14140:139-1062(-)
MQILAGIRRGHRRHRRDGIRTGRGLRHVRGLRSFRQGNGALDVQAHREGRRAILLHRRSTAGIHGPQADVREARRVRRRRAEPGRTDLVRRRHAKRPDGRRDALLDLLRQPHREIRPVHAPEHGRKRPVEGRPVVEDGSHDRRRGVLRRGFEARGRGGSGPIPLPVQEPGSLHRPRRSAQGRRSRRTQRERLRAERGVLQHPLRAGGGLLHHVARPFHPRRRLLQGRFRRSAEPPIALRHQDLLRCLPPRHEPDQRRHGLRHGREARQAGGILGRERERRGASVEGGVGGNSDEDGSLTGYDQKASR